MEKVILLGKVDKKLFQNLSDEVLFFENFSEIKDKNAIFIVNSEDKKALRFLSKTSSVAVTCGLSSKDTFTFSSKDDETAVVSLMRSVKSVYENTAEPMEIPISFPQNTDEYTILSLVATLILTEKISIKNNNKIYRL